MSVSTSRLHPDSRLELRAFVQRVQGHDSEAPLSEYKEMRLAGNIDIRERVAYGEDGSLVGYGQAAWHRGGGDVDGHWAIEIVVRPDLRDATVAGELIESLRLEFDGAEVILWARSPYVASAARATGWRRQRELLGMERSLPIDCLEQSIDDTIVSTFRMGVDEAAWLEANNAAFTGHPENGSITRRDLEHRISQPWFDADGFFLAWEGDRLIGSCWTKIHDDGVGEIYIVGVVPAWKGKGLGKALVCHGLDYLSRSRHVGRARLYVEGSNEAALGLYAKLGFETTRIIEAFAYPE